MENKNKNVSIVDENGNPGKRPLSMLRNFEEEEETTLGMYLNVIVRFSPFLNFVINLRYVASMLLLYRFWKR